MGHFKAQIRAGIGQALPPDPQFSSKVARAPTRRMPLDEAGQRLAVANVLRYFPPEHHARLAPEFLGELRERGRIYAYRYQPAYRVKARPIEDYPAEIPEAAGIQLMIMNNLDPRVALFPDELVTYGSNGTVFPHWGAYRLTMQLLSRMTRGQTLHMYSGHPMGLFPSSPDAPRVVIVNGMVIPQRSGLADYDEMAALGVTMYGQMTAGSWMYIGPQGIVHGTTLTLLNAARHYLGVPVENNLTGKVFVTSGLGGMSGAQAKAAVIAGAVGVIAEIDPRAIQKRLAQGWLQEATTDLDEVARRIDNARRAGIALSLGYQGNVVDLWEYLAAKEIPVDLGSDQTSCHNPYQGGYYPVGLTIEGSQRLMKEDPEAFKAAIHRSLVRQIAAIATLTERGLHFYDYGNRFLHVAAEAGAAVYAPDGKTFRFPSYVEHLMGPLCFDYGFGPFRWVCCSGLPKDLKTTDRIAMEVMESLAASAPPQIRLQMLDNVRWIRAAGANNLVVGSQARILYSDLEGRRAIAHAFNNAIRRKEIAGPIVLGRDHHDVSGTDSPLRETADITDGSAWTADMAVQHFAGLGFRGATWISLHHGGGTGWGYAINGGFGLVLDGTVEADARIDAMIPWDVSNGLARRSWARHEGARFAIERAMAADPNLQATLPQPVDPRILDAAFKP